MKCKLFQIRSVVAHRTLVLLSLMEQKASKIIESSIFVFPIVSSNSSESQPISSGKRHKAFKSLLLFVLHWFVEFQQNRNLSFLLKSLIKKYSEPLQSAYTQGKEKCRLTCNKGYHFIDVLHTVIY